MIEVFEIRLCPMGRVDGLRIRVSKEHLLIRIKLFGMVGLAAKSLLKIRLDFRLNGNARGFNTENLTLGGAATAYLLSCDTDRTGDPSGESH